MTRPSIPQMIRLDLQPTGMVETAFALGAQLPRRPGWVFYRKLKRRMAHRAEARFAELAADLGPDDVVLDLGANVGDMTVILARGGAQVHAFEPEPESFAILSDRCASLPNVTLHQAAVSDRDGTATLVLPASFRDKPRSASKAASIVHDRYRSGDHLEREVALIDIAAFVIALGSRITLIKIDIEGAEWDVLNRLMQSGTITQVETIFVETHERFDLSQLPMIRAQQAQAAARADVYVNLYWK